MNPEYVYDPVVTSGLAFPVDAIDCVGDKLAEPVEQPIDPTDDG